MLNLDISPVLLFKKVFISSVYPATIITRLSLWSSISFTSASTASLPKSFGTSGFISEYASSIKRTPPIACSTVSCTFIAVCPTYPATSPERSVSIILPSESIPSALYIFPTRRATVVLPVPGLPVNTIW